MKYVELSNSKNPIEKEFYWMNKLTPTTMDIDYILHMGWGQFIKAIHINVNKKICTSNKDKIADELLNEYPYQEINDLPSAIKYGGAIYMLEKTRNELRFHLFRKIFTQILFADKNKLIRFTKIHKEEYTSFLLSIAPYAINSTLEATTQIFRAGIYKLLEAKEEDYDLAMILSEIKYLWEYEHVSYTIDMFGNEYNNISSLPIRDRKKEHRKKEKFNKRKNEVLAFFKDYDISLDNIDEINNLEYKEDEFEFYQTALKATKKLLNDSLVSSYGTGKKRAEEISKILDYI
ncbi:hypothetical protein PF327_10185 [Sulfurovum sp. XTW-4]|uniref:Uncharacterized protein n=1 Tax=Sulfurovum xiamenensis TaxID=3019066 RepID=A0ABT7QU12_9BACT|nr:hypothetical protein [Sulfurovum xiamenensis]MDM5264561.1 hypothetical protein [Sulfurovum xiamenensis]